MVADHPERLMSSAADALTARKLCAYSFCGQKFQSPLGTGR